jgi:hypothetical protein
MYIPINTPQGGGADISFSWKKSLGPEGNLREI